MIATASATVAALELGFQLRKLQTIQRSIWSEDWKDLQDIWPSLEIIDHNVQSLGENLSGFDHAAWKELRNLLGDRHDAAASLGDDLRQHSKLMMAWQDQDRAA